MSEEKDKEVLFTLPLDYIAEQLQKTDEQVGVAQSLLQYFIVSEPEKHKWLIPLVVEVMWSNFGIVKALRPHTDDPVYYVRPDTGEKEYVISETALMSLQSLMIHRFYAGRELNRFSYSTRLH
tara:strand:- start:42 stop:410 length:369 start_codon:yes stop_codon:yes gene_type:complete